MNGDPIGLDVDFGNNLVLLYGNRLIKISNSGTLIWEKIFDTLSITYSYRYLGTKLRINKTTGDIFFLGKENTVNTMNRVDTNGNLIERVSLNNTGNYPFVSLYGDAIHIAIDSSDQTYGDNLIESDTTTGTRTNILKYGLTTSVDKYK